MEDPGNFAESLPDAEAFEEAQENPDLTSDQIPEPEIAQQEHVPEMDSLPEAVPIATESPPPVIEVDEQLSNDFIQAKMDRPKMIPPFGTAGSLSTVVNCIRDGNRVLSAVVAQLRDLNASIRMNLNS
jgi:hypothetical protein